MKNKFSKYLVNLGAVIAIPLNSSDGFTELQFRNLAANQVSYSADGLKVDVKTSASPLIYKLPAVVEISQLDVEIEISGEIKAESGATAFPEDAYFRLGLVAQGDKTLNRMQKWLAPAWVEKLYSLAPAGVGLDKIYFYNVVAGPSTVGTSRIHPQSELMSEEIVVQRTSQQKKVTFTHKVSPPRKVAALWISIDGDQSKSQFTTLIKKISLTTTAP